MNQHVKNRKIRLIEKDLTETKIARLIGVSQQAVHCEIMGGGQSERLRQAISLMVGTTPEEFFPEVYGGKVNAEQPAQA